LLIIKISKEREKNLKNSAFYSTIHVKSYGFFKHFFADFLSWGEATRTEYLYF
jgi:hypothetical protein